MLNRLFITLMGVGICVFLAGCGPDAGHDADHDHGAAGDHDHAEAEGQAAENGHEHAEEGPHGGHLIELGEGEHHAELTHDEATHTVTVYLLDAGGRTPVEADGPEITLQLFQDGEFVDYTLTAAQGASTFSLVDEKLCDTLLHADEIRGRLHVAIDGQGQTGMIDHHAHDHEGHDHTGHEHE
jgi:hypothetical protein